MPQRLKNAARAALSAPIGAGDTSLTIGLTVADLFPAANTGTDPVNTPGKDWFKLVLEDVNHNYEIIYARTRTLGSGVISNLLRGQEGTTAISFAAGSTIVGLRITAEDHENALELSSQATPAGKAMVFAADADAQALLIGGALQKNLATAFTTSGSGTAYAITPTHAVAAYVANLAFDVTFHVASGNDPTLQVSGLESPPSLVRRLTNGGYTNVRAGEIPAGQRSRVVLISPTQAVVEVPRGSLAGVAGADIASAATLDLTGRTGNIVRITGSIATSAVTLENGGQVWCYAVGAWPLTHHATNFPLQGAANYTCEAGDVVLITKDNSGAISVQIIRRNGQAVSVAQPGAVQYFAMSSAPAGWLKANGAAVSRTAYAALFAAIGTTYGVGDGATTFNLPELRGEFLRALDDGRGVDTSRGLGTAQGDAIRNITGSFVSVRPGANGAFAESNEATSASAAGTGLRVTFDASRQVPTASENRPRNVAMLACIKF